MGLKGGGGKEAYEMEGHRLGSDGNGRGKEDVLVEPVAQNAASGTETTDLDAFAFPSFFSIE